MPYGVTLLSANVAISRLNGAQMRKYLTGRICGSAGGMRGRGPQVRYIHFCQVRTYKGLAGADKRLAVHKTWRFCSRRRLCRVVCAQNRAYLFTECALEDWRSVSAKAFLLRVPQVRCIFPAKSARRSTCISFLLRTWHPKQPFPPFPLPNP